MIKGIGPHFAKKLVRAFGEEVFDVIETATRGRQTLDRVSAQPNSVAQSPYVVGSRANRIPESSRVIPDYPG